MILIFEKVDKILYLQILETMRQLMKKFLEKRYICMN